MGDGKEIISKGNSMFNSDKHSLNDYDKILDGRYGRARGFYSDDELESRGLITKWKRFWRKVVSFFKPSKPDSPDNPDNPSGQGDEVPFSDLVWSYGGVNGSGGTLRSDVSISNLSFRGQTLYYKWDKGGCENFGASNDGDYSKTICAVFFKDSSGKYIGGKFDWISTNRLSRGLGNVRGGYGGWNYGAISNPADAVFLICSPSGQSRTNVIKCVWQR